uniref:Bestrophin homolog n=1 Tax=Bursaphelenchus xylophilus TaxID=6326 RepID=A0A1I7RWN3_BURXY
MDEQEMDDSETDFWREPGMDGQLDSHFPLKLDRLVYSKNCSRPSSARGETMAHSVPGDHELIGMHSDEETVVQEAHREENAGLE